MRAELPWRAMRMFSLASSLVAALSAEMAAAVEVGGAGASHSGEITFNHDLAPVIFRHCAPCHRPGGAGPFSVLRYADARKRAREMAEVASGRVMPPWLPAQGEGEWLESRRISEGAVCVFERWGDGGGLEGAAEGMQPS